MDFKSRRSQTKGVVLIELLLVTPLLILIPMGVIEMVRALRMAQIANVISQEVATTVYRQCSDFARYAPDDNQSSVALETRRCIEAHVRRFQGQLTGTLDPVTNLPQVLNPYFPNLMINGQSNRVASIRAAVFRYDGIPRCPTPNPAPTCEDEPVANSNRDLWRVSSYQYLDSTFVNHGFSETYSPSAVSTSGQIVDQNGNVLVTNANVADRRRIVVVQVEFYFVPVVRFVRWFMVDGNDNKIKKTSVI